MKTLNNTLILIMFLLFTFSCDDILEEDITNDMVQITFPTEGTIVDGNTVQFTWQNLEGADGYRIQIIKSNHIFEVDSLITTNIFTYTIDPGTYQWRVRGGNFAYETAYTFPIGFTVEASSDLTDQDVVLLTPSVAFYTNKASTIFTWSKLTNATSYNFELIKKIVNEQTILQQAEILSNSLTIDASLFDEDAEYIWKVKAVNETSETVYSKRSLFLDSMAPSQPALTSPEDQATSTKTVTFNWTNGTDTGNIKSVITNTVEIASDINFNTVIHSEKTANNSYQHIFSVNGTFYWRVKAIDAATNQSDYSIVRSVVVE